MRCDKVEVEVQKRDRERVEGYRKPAVLSVTVAAQRLRVCAAWRQVLLGFGEGERVRTEGVT
jgi:hypothetical protein